MAVKFTCLLLCLLPTGLWGQKMAGDSVINLKSIKKRSDFPKGYFDLDFRYKHSETTDETLEMKYLEVGLKEMPKYLVTFDPISIVTSAGAGGFGAYVSGFIRPVDFIDIQAALFAPYVAFNQDYRKDDNGNFFPGTYHFFTANFSPAFLLTAKTKIKLRKSGLAGSHISYNTIRGYVFKIPTIVTHQIGIQPNYYYVQGSYYDYATNTQPGYLYGFQNNVVGASLMYKRTSHAVLSVKDHMPRRYSTILYLYAGFLYGAHLKYNSVYSDTAGKDISTRVSVPFSSKLGYLAGIDYQATINTIWPFYLDTKLEFGNMPAIADGLYVNVSLGFTFYVAKPYRNRYDLSE